jgi:hypothetical protein
MQNNLQCKNGKVDAANAFNRHIYAIEHLKKNRRAVILLVCLFISFNCLCQRNSCIEINPDESFTVHSVRIIGRWIPEELKRKVVDLIDAGQAFSNSKVSAAQLLISNEAKKSENIFPPQLAGAVAVSLITVNYCSAGTKEVDIVFYAHYLRIDMISMGNNLLPVPRSPKLSFYDKIPRSLLVANPVLKFSNDRRYGSSLGIQTLTNLLHPELPGTSKKLRLNLGIEARKSLVNSFYHLGGNLELDKPSVGNNLGWGIGINYHKKQEPIGIGEWNSGNFMLQGMLQGPIKFSFLKKYMTGAGFRSLENVFDTATSGKDKNNEKGYGFFLVTDGVFKKKLTRLGIWFDYGSPESKSSYQRVASRLGFNSSINISKDSHQQLDLELGAGAGWSNGSLPVYHQFFAGNSNQSFLYEPLGSNRIRTMPAGPLVRSIGESEGVLQAGNIQGGTSYWHLNLNLSIPIARWSRPLIPAIVINEETGATLQTKLKSLAKGSAASGIAIDLIDNKGYPENDETDSIAEAMVEKNIMPMIEFVTDKANLFSVKPVLLFDVASLKQQNIAQTTWMAAGGGIQLTIVIARLQAGYMRTIHSSTGNRTGNFFMQFVFENFY